MKIREALWRLRRSLFVRILSLVFASLVVAQGINFILLALVRPPPPASVGISELTAAIGRGPDALVPWLDREMRSRPWPSDPRDGIVATKLTDAITARLALPRDAVHLDLDPQQSGRVVHMVARGNDPRALEPALVGHFVVSIRQPDGRWMILHPAGPALFGDWQRQFLVLFLLGALLMLPAAWLFARRLAEPFRELASAAERLGRDPSAPPPDVHGTIEAQQAANAFREMQRRLRAYVDDRTHMVGAIAHDLRTPLTRLAFRIESLDGPIKDAMAHDVADMEAMVAAAMSFVRGTNERRRRERLELGSLVERVADDIAMTGRDVTAEVSGNLVIDGDQIALKRLFANLFENGLKFGTRVRARAFREGRFAVVEVDDDGPGLPQQEMERVFEPFYRAERSRSRETGGIGLGLSVVRSIVRAHGGDVTLSNRAEGGLRARVCLPLEPTAAKSGG